MEQPPHPMTWSRYQYVANQDMDQRWSPGGLDGVRLSSVAFSGSATFDSSSARREADRAAVEDREEARHFLICRYD